MLIIAALVTESLQPVIEPMRIQNAEWTKNALFRFNFKALSIMGRHTRKPAKWVPDTAKRCEQQDILKSRLTSFVIKDLSPAQTAAVKAREFPSNSVDTAFKAFFLILKNAS